MNRSISTALALAAVALFIAACAQVEPTHVATLEPTALTSDAGGSATARLVGDDLTVEGTYENLSGPPNGAEVLDETDDTVLFTLATEASGSGSFSGAGTLSGARIDNLDAGDVSIRIYTDAYPKATTVGEVEGNLAPN